MADPTQMGNKRSKAGRGASHSATENNRRAYPRLGADQLMSSLGLVLDLSRGGLCVLAAAGPKKEEFTIVLEADPPTELAVRVAWCRKLGRKRFELGLEFCEMSPEQTLALTDICQTYRYRRAM